MRHVIQGDAGGGEGLLRGTWHLRHVAERRDDYGALDTGGSERRRDPVGDPLHVDADGDLAVLEIPPHRNLHAPVLLIVVPPEGRRRRAVRFGPPPVGIVAGGGVEGPAEGEGMGGEVQD